VAGLCLAVALVVPLQAAGPVESGRVEIRHSLEARKLPSASFRHAIEQSASLPLESFQIQGALIRGGSPRAIMFALMEAAESIARRGVISSATGQAQLSIRGVRRTLTAYDIALPREAWRAWFRSLAFARFNRARLIFDSGPGLPDDPIRLTTELAEEYGIDLTIEPASPIQPSLRDTLRISPAIRAIRTTAADAGLTAEVVKSAGRYVVVETDPGVAIPANVPSRVLAPWKPGAPRPCGPSCDFVWIIPGAVQPSPALLDSGAAGFEIDHLQLEDWSGFGYSIKQGAAPATKSTVRKKSTSPTKKTTTKKKR
jgi:hypothetical protein